MQEDSDDGYDFLDIITAVAESWIIIVLLPLIVGVAAIAYVATSKPVYRVEATMDKLDDAPRVGSSVRFLNALSSGTGVPVSALGTNIVVANDDKKLESSVVFSDTTAEKGQEVVALAVKLLREYSMRAEAKYKLRVSRAEDGVQRLQDSIKQLEAAIKLAAQGQAPDGQLPADVLSKALVEITKELDTRFGVLDVTREQLAGFSAPPVISTTPRYVDKRVVVFSAGLAGFAAFCLALVRHALTRTRGSLKYAQMVNRIRRSFFMKERPLAAKAS